MIGTKWARWSSQRQRRQHPFVERGAFVVCASAAKDKDNFARLTGTHSGASSNLFDAEPPAGITKRSNRPVLQRRQYCFSNLLIEAVFGGPVKLKCMHAPCSIFSCFDGWGEFVPASAPRQIDVLLGYIVAVEMVKSGMEHFSPEGDSFTCQPLTAA